MRRGSEMKIRYLLLIAITGAAVCLDQLIKSYVHARFHVGESIRIIEGWFNITYVRNPGAAFGFLAGSDHGFREPFFLVLPPLAMILILFLMRGVKDSDRTQTVALSLVFGGALGNYIDRLRFGYVVDFLDFHVQEKFVWPAFNVADSCIVVGIGILLILSFVRKETSKATAE